ncbi:6-carboxyhexanoate--CoA ligase [Methanococcus maripaludis]|uniref:6-carboxyhexanoate--CoA ligase n=2 Tax=Methanococcus maripaludis TaxID=39152 RepID=BIOW_METM7|nr:6-carboxyhexanoate--CoA ligase [Methanococcus maripaludis]A6VHG3.1 RecName: Full=6-carboxyhexanoate--CoA ligase; AltName: Full=Pimeloyl-CoA synthase [Methanococcus maripaludis C7]MBA2861545.1 6-carboxyhexanoate--CoA ligase [Methanococcus maripaludis]
MFSLKMRASRNGKHVSGAERLVTEEKIEEISSELIKRAMGHENGVPDFINLKIEKVTEKINNLKHLEIKTVHSTSKETSRVIARNLLKNELEKYYLKNGKDIEKIDELIDFAFKIIDEGNMRGAAILDLDGNRLETDSNRGIRVKNIDTTDELSEKILGNSSLSERTVDAIAIATKVVNCGVISELCTSDNFSYTTGYIATKDGYFRILNLKGNGEVGGRVFFVENSKIDELYDKLENMPVIVY